MTCIAVIDDNIVSQSFMADVFVERGWDVISCCSSEEVAATLLRPGAPSPDAIILDLHLHERDAGMNVLESLKSNPGTSNVPVILCSADVWALQSLPQAVQADVAAVLVKPFEIDEAYRCVEYVLDQSHTSSP